jgi:hypothetical protein
MGAEHRGEAGLVETLFGDADHGVVELVDGLVGIDAISGQKIECTQEAGALVAVNIRLIIGDVVGVGGRNLEEICLPVKILVYRLGEGRFEGVFVRMPSAPPNARREAS